MKSSAALVLALCGVVAVGAAPAHAAPKPKPSKGSYTVTAPPDPTMEGTGAAGKQCFNVDPASRNDHPLGVPGKGTLHVVLDGQDIQGKTDWDLYLIDADGTTLDASHGPTAHEETTDVFKAKRTVTIRACNLLGTPTATVTWTFTPKK